MTHVALCTPCQDQVSAGFAYDLAKLVAHVGQTDVQLSLHQVRGTYIPQQRETLVRNALDVGATHVLFVDSDMRFPKDTLDRLLAHQLPIVAVNYSTRRPPIWPTAQHKSHGHLFTTPESTGLQPVTHAGTGCMLIEARVFRGVPEPWFVLGYNPKDKEYVSEDYFFCTQASKSGFRIMIDQDLSKEVRHIGEIEFRAEHAILTRDQWNAGPQTERKLELVADGAD